MMSSLERRIYKRCQTRCDMRIYTKLIAGAYSVQMLDISRSGAFLISTAPPRVGEIITYEILNTSYKVVASGNAKVVRLKTSGPVLKRGFAVSFQKEIDGRLFESIIK